MNDTYLNATATHGGSLITHIGLKNAGVELSGGTYARKPVTWTAAAAGLIRPTADLTFDVPAGSTVDGWSGFSALTVGTEYGGAALTAETFAAAGTYSLTASATGIDHNAA
jgi:hypothetical protein